MKIKIIHSFKNANNAIGLTVVIDVFRAFTTACFVANNGAEKIIPIADINAAYNLKRDNPSYILMGEREGVRPQGFDYGNSPAEIESVHFKNKTIIHTTTTGTQAIIGAKNAKEIITGSFVNAGAVINYISKRKPNYVSLLCAHDMDEETEDAMFAKFVRDYLEGTPMDFKAIKNYLEHHPRSKWYIDNSPVLKKDFYLCLDLNRFHFVLKVESDKRGLIYLRKLNQT